MRSTSIERNTNETQIKLTLNIDGKGEYENDTGCGFLNHMLDLFARHGRFDLFVTCRGDVEVDYHHTAEDIAITLGTAFKKCLGDMRGINRYGSVILPMDETLMIAAVDISGRAALGFDADFKSEKIGDFDTELVKEFMLAFSRSLGAAVHLKQLSGENSHHIAEAMFKALARALRQAVEIDMDFADQIPSTKGVL